MTIAAAFIMPHPPVIIPEIGKGQEKEIQRTIDAFREAAREIAEMKPDTIVVISPHSTAYEHYFHISPGKAATGNFGRFGAREVEIHAEYDEEFGKYLSKEAYKQGINAGATAFVELFQPKFSDGAIFMQQRHQIGHRAHGGQIKILFHRFKISFVSFLKHF